MPRCAAFGGDYIIGIWDHPNLHFHRIDITDHAEVDVHLAEYSPWAIVDLAAIGGDPGCKREPEFATRTNWEASKHLIDSACEASVERFVFASTCGNYETMADPNDFVRETSPLAPVSPYAELKVKFEDYFLHEIERTDSFTPTSLRFATVYGLSHRMRFDLTDNEFTKEVALGRTLEIFGEQFRRRYYHVREFSRAITSVLDIDRERVVYDVFNVGDTDQNFTKRMIATGLLRQIPDAKIVYVTKNEDLRDYRVNLDKIKSRLGFEISRTVPEGVTEVRDPVQLNVIQDPDEQRFFNIPHPDPDA